MPSPIPERTTSLSKSPWLSPPDHVQRHLLEVSLFLDRDHRGRHLWRRAGSDGFHRVAQGVYAFEPRPDDPDWLRRDRAAFTQISATLVAAPPGTVIGYEHAALLHGAPVRKIPPAVRVISPHTTSTTHRPLGRRRHTRTLRPDHVVRLDGIPVTSLVRTAVDCARSCDIVEALVIVDYLLHRSANPNVYRREEGQMRMDRARRDMLALIDAESGYRGNRQARSVIRAADGWAQSRLESEARRFCLALGMPGATLQFYVPTVRGDSFTDLGFEFDVGGTVVVSHLEVDGDVKYGSIADFRSERHREAEIRALGHLTARVDTDLLGTWSIRDFQRRIAQLVPRSVQVTLEPDPQFMTPWERANARVSWLDPRLPHPHR